MGKLKVKNFTLHEIMLQKAWHKGELSSFPIDFISSMSIQFVLIEFAHHIRSLSLSLENSALFSLWVVTSLEYLVVAVFQSSKPAVSILF